MIVNATRLQDISEVSVLSIGQIQELLFGSHSHFSLPYTVNLLKTDTNLGYLDLDTFPLIIYRRDIYIIVRVIRGLRITPFVLTCQ